MNIIAVSSYSNRELNKTYINDEYGFIYAYDSDKLGLLKSFGGNNYPYYVWLDKNDEIMYFSSLSFVEDLYSIDCAILGKKIGKEIGNVCISKNINLLDKDGNKGTQVQQNIKKHMPIVGHFEKVIHDGKMPRTGDGQKFSDPLYKAQQNRVPNAH